MGGRLWRPAIPVHSRVARPAVVSVGWGVAVILHHRADAADAGGRRIGEDEVDAICPVLGAVVHGLDHGAEVLHRGGTERDGLDTDVALSVVDKEKVQLLAGGQ